MNTETKTPTTLMEAVKYFADTEVSQAFFVNVRWPAGVCCPHCGSTDVAYLKNQRRWQCRDKHPRRQFSAKVGTIFEESPLPLEKWLVCIWLEINAKNSISSCELARALGITQKSAWFMLHRVRIALASGSFEQMGGDGSAGVEADETYVGGLSKNMHRSKRAKLRGTGGFDKAAVAGLLERSVVEHKDGKRKVARPSKVVASVIPNTQSQTLHPIIYRNVQKGSALFTDAHRAYFGLSSDFVHGVIDHAEKYVDGNIHTNGLENFWTLFKRCIKGTHVSVEPFHLQAYLDSEIFRFNNRKMTDRGRFVTAMPGVIGKRLTYKALIGAVELEGRKASDSGEGDAIAPN
jgi:transposase-like protein